MCECEKRKTETIHGRAVSCHFFAQFPRTFDEQRAANVSYGPYTSEHWSLSWLQGGFCNPEDDTGTVVGRCYRHFRKAVNNLNSFYIFHNPFLLVLQYFRNEDLEHGTYVQVVKMEDWGRAHVYWAICNV